MGGKETLGNAPETENQDGAPCVTEMQALLSQALTTHDVDDDFWAKIGAAVFDLRHCGRTEGILQVQVDAYQVVEDPKANAESANSKEGSNMEPQVADEHQK